ncbi:hypothetical protein Mkiyose1665_12710 [Mycobacterium kiyosense]|uniref:Uncharacterized protein n=1 Tax=Mycobacterium kiyosense TaxID=2871094 RepID=A0A9P3Q671_9MYCO|nr:hypothetical protein IWGMT90018_03290 [Mycobacterium kiyosense]BDE11734.1 hypothetical protein MKCMC460_05940 [Mycobacterium sp. 20KCMC460]GLB85051.1 hypothetical protein SRL2020028_43070 [Mycobacterium kiyosense]GLB88027.1 hypothetical protein SRL2020130_08440 [Mycobacterium kiyosense]GLB95415.1 hypothetical protein SRL2020226_21910 [Mycobacterium kiyosense]
MLEPGRVGGQGGRVAEVLDVGVLNHTPFDVTALRGIVGGILPDGNSLVHQIHDATGTRRGSLRIAHADMCGI